MDLTSSRVISLSASSARTERFAQPRSPYDHSTFNSSNTSKVFGIHSRSLDAKQTPTAFLQMPAGIPRNSRDFPTKINPLSIPRTARRSPDRLAMRVAGAMAHVCAETSPRGPHKGTRSGNSAATRRLERATTWKRIPLLPSPFPLHSARFGFTRRYVFALIARSHVPRRLCREKIASDPRSAERLLGILRKHTRIHLARILPDSRGAESSLQFRGKIVNTSAGNYFPLRAPCAYARACGS